MAVVGERLMTAAPAIEPVRTMVSCRRLIKDYALGDVVVHALRDVSVDIEEGEFVAVMGASGSGKSTFMNMVGALDTPSAGEVRINGRDISNMSSDELALLRNETLGFVFQQFNLLARTSAIDNVKMPLLYTRKKPTDLNARAAECLALVGLSERGDHHPSQLSGGQQQRVAIARALVNDPKILLADEPTGALDTATSGELMLLFQDLNRRGITIVLVTHEAEIAAYARRILVFRDGRLMEDRR